MSALSAHVEAYLRMRRALGYRLVEYERILTDLVAAVQRRGEAHLSGRGAGRLGAVIHLVQSDYALPILVSHTKPCLLGGSCAEARFSPMHSKWAGDDCSARTFWPVQSAGGHSGGGGGHVLRPVGCCSAGFGG